jgi:hypothetical protein
LVRHRRYRHCLIGSRAPDPWTPEQTAAGREVREALATAVKVIVANVPPSADRTVAIRKIREARMDANSAITHNGKY